MEKRLQPEGGPNPSSRKGGGEGVTSATIRFLDKLAGSLSRTLKDERGCSDTGGIQMESSFNSQFDVEGKFYEFVYRAGEASPEWNRRVLGFYIPFFSNCHRVLDVGCGQGEFLELLRERGISGIGIDIDAEMIRICRSKGLNVAQADLFEYLAGHESDFDGVFCSNVIEHMGADKVLRFFQLVYQALRPNGIFLVATPNPESLIVHLYEFWRDPTHVRLYSRSLLEFMMEYAGFRNINSGENPETQWLPQGVQDLPPNSHPEAIERMNAVAEQWNHCRNDWGIGRSPVNSNAQNTSFFIRSYWDRSIDLFEIPDLPGNRGPIGRWLFSIRRRIARFIVKNVLFEEWVIINQLQLDVHEAINRLNRAIGQLQLDVHQLIGLTKPREIYALGVKIDDVVQT
ncbi:MAG: class I SAM-dependent methyltransferase [Anaerolineae bacterium]|nr:class I SAM-dependent methyltransferase [Anaerolineae bacterium]